MPKKLLLLSFSTGWGWPIPSSVKVLIAWLVYSAVTPSGTVRIMLLANLANAG